VKGEDMEKIQKEPIDWFFVLQATLISIFLLIFVYSTFRMFADTTPTQFIVETYKEFKTLFLGIVGWETIKAIKKQRSSDSQGTVPDNTNKEEVDVKKDDAVIAGTAS